MLLISHSRRWNSIYKKRIVVLPPWMSDFSGLWVSWPRVSVLNKRSFHHHPRFLLMSISK
ncbi:unnamed protein product [Brassica rapa subsp. narinosa]